MQKACGLFGRLGEVVFFTDYFNKAPRAGATRKVLMRKVLTRKVQHLKIRLIVVLAAYSRRWAKRT